MPVERRETPKALSLEGKRVLVGSPHRGAEKAVVLVEDDRELLIHGSFTRFVLCLNETTGLRSDVPFEAVLIKPGDIIKITYPLGHAPILPVSGGVRSDGVEVEVYTVAPAGEHILEALTPEGHFIVRKQA